MSAERASAAANPAIRATWRHPMVARLMALAGAFGLLLPMLTAPVTTDSRYHYLLSLGRFPGGLPDIAAWTVDDIGWRMADGRVAPVGVFVQHVVYWLGMRLSLATGLEIYQVEALVKLGLLALVVLAWRLLLGQLSSDAGGAGARRLRDAATVAFATLLVAGVTTTLPVRNGWTTFVVLCIGGTALLFAVSALTLWAARHWAGAGRGWRLATVAALVLTGAALVLSYELHWAAFPAAVVLVCLLGRRPGRWPAVLALSAGFVPTLAVTRWLVAVHDAPDRYPGLVTDLGGPVLQTTGWQVVNAIPGSGLWLVREQLGDGVRGPAPFSGGGWLWGLLLAVGAALWVGRLLTGTSPVGHAPPARPWWALSLACLTGLVAAAALLSVSAQSHDIVSGLGPTYRGTPWLWAALAGALTAALAATTARVGRPSGRPRASALALVPAVVALLVGAVVWPANLAATATLRTEERSMLLEQAQRHVVLGAQDPVSQQERCLIDARLVEVSRGAYATTFITAYREAFELTHGVEFCAEETPAGDP